MTITAAQLHADWDRQTEDWGVFRPAILRGTVLSPLPQPVRSLTVRDAWDFTRSKVPLRDGDNVAGWSRDGLDVVVKGEILADPDSTTPEVDLFTAVESLRTQLDSTASQTPFEFFLHQDGPSGVYRRVRSCTAVKLEWDLVGRCVLVYELVVHASDPTLVTTAPPSS